MNALHPIYLAALGFAGLQMTLLLVLFFSRLNVLVSQKRASNSFAADGGGVPPFTQRATRAHLNCAENMAVFALIVLVAFATGRIEALNSLAYAFLATRLCQSSIHLISTSNRAVLLRATCFFAQVIIQAYWIFRLLIKA